MEKIKPNPGNSSEEPAVESEMTYNAQIRNMEEISKALESGEEFFSENEILSLFTPEQQAEIKQKKQILSSLAYFIGKDFRVPIELGLPTRQCPSGWRQGKDNNGNEFLQMNAYDLLEKSMALLRFFTCHEGGHKRISRPEIVPLDIWRQSGFAFMMNAIEDPRDNNFVAESYPRFGEQMNLFYEEQSELERKAKLDASDKLGFQPRFMQAGWEYIKQWFRETKREDVEITSDLSDEIKTVIKATIEHARDSWWRYPSKEEADKSEELIKKYAKVSYEINRDEIWPEFKKLVDEDVKDQKIQELLKKVIEDILKDLGGGEGGLRDSEASGNDQSIPQELKDKLTPEEEKELEDAIKKSIDENSKSRTKNSNGDKKEGESSPDDKKESESMPAKSSKATPVNLDSLSEGLKQKIKEYIESLPEDQQKEIAEKAEATLKEFEDELNEQLQGKLSDDPEKKAIREKAKQEEESGQATISAGERVISGQIQKTPAEIAGMRVFSEKLHAVVEKDENNYEKYRREVIPLIDKLEAELRQIFIDRQIIAWKGGFKGGKRIDIKKRIQEKAKDVPVMESRAWQKRELPKEVDYAITLLNDVSGSMAWDGKNTEDVKAKIVLAEVLNRIGINVEILGFNDELIEYQNFGQDISKQIREHIGKMPEVAISKMCDVCRMDHNATDIGWATQMAAERLSKQKAKRKFLITLSDYQLEESQKHPAEKFRLNDIVKKVLEETNIKIIGLGVGPKTEHVSKYYPSSIANIKVKEMAEKLASLIKDVIANYDKF